MDGLDHVLLRARLCVGFRAETFNLQMLVLLNICLMSLGRLSRDGMADSGDPPVNRMGRLLFRQISLLYTLS